MLPHDPLSAHFRLTAAHKRALSALGLHTVRDLLYHFPSRYETEGTAQTVTALTQGAQVTLYGTLRTPETRLAWRTKRPLSEAWLEDGTGKVKLMWFNQPYIAKMFADGAPVKISGRVEGASTRYIANPDIAHVATLPLTGADTVFGAEEGLQLAVYPERKGLSSRWLRYALDHVLKAGAHTLLEDPVPTEIRTRYHLPSLHTALMWLHQPKSPRDAEAARKRFAFEEVLVIQTAKQQARRATAAQPCITIENGAARIAPFLQRLPYSLTRGQRAAVDAILSDMAAPPAMGRLLEGDVGSGKTAVAAATAYAVVTAHPPARPSAPLQVAYMAPTELLAEQHFASFCELFSGTSFMLGLITGSGCKKFPSKVNPRTGTTLSKAQLLKHVAQGEVAVLIGTHALIFDAVRFRDLAYVIIDEQHRFGTGQRMRLMRKDGVAPHLLSMTATPIPRTLALTMYGDLDLTVLDEMPPGRKPVQTRTVTKTERPAMYTAVRAALDAGRQAYVICPRIDEPDPQKELALQTKSVMAEAERLKRQELKGYRIGVLHGGMKPKEKEETMRSFLAHTTDVLVATSVVEVGVNVPNATVIVIEGAERFGLAQLHQLRGRVVRSTHQAQCFVLTSEGGVTTRLKALEKAKNGFELAEMDLKLRGPGELYGRVQSGLSDLGMEALKNLKLVEAARTEAERIAREDPGLERSPALAEAVLAQKDRLHFE